jgi:hypothetical protein
MFIKSSILKFTCETLNFSAGLAKSANPAPTNAHFIVGA